MARWLSRWFTRRAAADPDQPTEKGTPMSELHEYDVEINGVATTVQLTAEEAKLRFPDAKPNKATASEATQSKTVPTDDDATSSATAVQNKARRN